MSMQRKHRPAEDGPRDGYDHLGDLVLDISEILRPPERLTPSEAAARYRHLNNPGSYVGPWKNETTPYMVEPVDLLTSREYGAIVFVGPAQCGKTDTILLNPIIYGAVCDPMDMLIYQTSQTMAADFSRRRVDRMIRQNDCLSGRLLGGASADTTFNKVFRSGMMVTLSWPTINELSGRPVGRVFLTDYDRMPQDIDGEGSPFDLARKRTTTFGRVGKTFVESSPGFIQRDPQPTKRRLLRGSPPCTTAATGGAGIGSAPTAASGLSRASPC
jgi:phage terminase large subunit GpA-like protein